MRINELSPADWCDVDPTPLQRSIRRVVTRPGRWWLRFRAYGPQPRVPEDGGFLLAPGPHGAYRDPFVFALGQPRTRLRFMAKFQVLEWPVAGRLVRWGGGFPVRRGGGRGGAALQVAQAVVESGDGVVIFMEGRLVLDHDGLGTPRDGLAKLALATGAPVVPVAAYGTKRAVAYGRRWWSHRPTVTMVWGEPLTFVREVDPSSDRVGEVRDEIWAHVSRCFDEARAIAQRAGGRPPHDTPLAEALA